MKIILKENIDNLGKKGDIVNVAAGYGRNYLIPKNLALQVTASNQKMIEMEQAALRKHLEKARMSFQDVIARLNEVAFTFERKAGEKDTIFGSVSITDIKDELDKLGFEIEKKKIGLKEPIKRLGNYTVPIKVFLDDVAEIKVQVIPEGGADEDTVAEEVSAESGAEEKAADRSEAEEAVVAEEASAGSPPKEKAADTPGGEGEAAPEPEAVSEDEAAAEPDAPAAAETETEPAEKAPFPEPEANPEAGTPAEETGGGETPVDEAPDKEAPAAESGDGTEPEPAPAVSDEGEIIPDEEKAEKGETS